MENISFWPNLEAHSLNTLCRCEQKVQNKITELDLPKTRSEILVRDHSFQVSVKKPKKKIESNLGKRDRYYQANAGNYNATIGLPHQTQTLIQGGGVLQDTKYLWEYRIAPLTTIIFNLRLRGGATINNTNPNRAGGSGTCNSMEEVRHLETAYYYKFLNGAPLPFHLRVLKLSFIPQGLCIKIQITRQKISNSFV